MAYLFDTGIFSAVTTAGAVMSGARLYFYTAGTSAKRDTYTDSSLPPSAKNTNPVIADANGRFPSIWLDNALYKVVFTDPTGAVISTRDNVGDVLTASLSSRDGAAMIGTQNGSNVQAELDADGVAIADLQGDVDLVEGQIEATNETLTNLQIQVNGLANSSAYLFTVAKDTRANLYADLQYPANSLGLVWNDSTPAYNGFYVKSGAVGAGAWTITTIPYAATVDIIAQLTALLASGTGTTHYFTDADGWVNASLDKDGFTLPWVGSAPTEYGAIVVTDPDGWVYSYTLFDGEAGSSAPPPSPCTIARPWMGALTDTSVAFAADVEGDGPGVVEIEVSTDQYFTNIVATTPAKVGTVTERSANQDWRSINQVVNGLDPDTAYWARFLVDGRVSDDTLTFTTAPEQGVAAAYRFALMSCTLTYPTTDCQVHRAIASFDPLFTIHTGDLQYTDISVNDVRLPRALNTRRYRDNADVQGLTAKSPYFYAPDDHDYANNDCYWEKTFTSGATYEQIGENTRRAYRETVPMDARIFPQMVAGETDPDKLLTTQQFDIGNTRHILLDTRTQMSRANGTFLGNDSWAPYWNQLAWLKSALVQAGSDGVDRVFIHTPTFWGATAGEISGYFSAERTAISDYIRDTVGIPPVSITTGDWHILGVDDATHSDFATGGGLCTGLLVSSGAFQSTGQDTTDQWTWDGVDTFVNLPQGEIAQFFAIIDVDVDGEWAVNFYGGPYTGTTPTLLGTYAMSDSIASVQFPTSTFEAPASTVAQIPIIRSWVSRAGIPSVNWSTNNGQSGSASFRPNSKNAFFPVNVPASGSITVTISSPSNGTLGATTVLTLTAT